MHLVYTDAINVGDRELKALYEWGRANGFAPEHYHATEILKAMAHSFAERHLHVEGVRLDMESRLIRHGHRAPASPAAEWVTPSIASAWWTAATPGVRQEFLERIGALQMDLMRFVVEPLTSPAAGRAGN